MLNYIQTAGGKKKRVYFGILTYSLMVKKTLPSALCLTPAIINLLYFSEEQTNIFSSSIKLLNLMSKIFMLCHYRLYIHCDAC